MLPSTSSGRRPRRSTAEPRRSPPAASASACASRPWRNICGVCARHRPARGSVATMRPSSAPRLSVSATGMARMPPTSSASTRSISRAERRALEAGPRRIVHQHPVVGIDHVRRRDEAVEHAVAPARAAAVERRHAARERRPSRSRRSRRRPARAPRTPIRRAHRRAAHAPHAQATAGRRRRGTAWGRRRRRGRPGPRRESGRSSARSCAGAAGQASVPVDPARGADEVRREGDCHMGPYNTGEGSADRSAMTRPGAGPEFFHAGHRATGSTQAAFRQASRLVRRAGARPCGTRGASARRRVRLGAGCAAAARRDRLVRSRPARAAVSRLGNAALRHVLAAPGPRLRAARDAVSHFQRRLRRRHRARPAPRSTGCSPPQYLAGYTFFLRRARSSMATACARSSRWPATRT